MCLCCLIGILCVKTIHFQTLFAYILYNKNFIYQTRSSSPFYLFHSKQVFGTLTLHDIFCILHSFRVVRIFSFYMGSSR